jgi:hypothetical protein
MDIFNTSVDLLNELKTYDVDHQITNEVLERAKEVGPHDEEVFLFERDNYIDGMYDDCVPLLIQRIIIQFT